MYELTCPSCAQKRVFPFLRPGARSVCAKCEHTWQISAEHIRHEVELIEPPAGENPLLLGATTPKPPPPMRPKPPAPPPPPPPPPPEPPKPHSEPPSPSVARMIAQRRAARRRRQQLVTLLVVFGVLLLLVIGVAVGLNTQRGANIMNMLTGGGPPAIAPPTRAPGAERKDTPPPPNLPIFTAERLTATDWEEVYQHYEHQLPSQLLRLSSGRLGGGTGAYSVYVADLVCEGRDVVELAMVDLLLIDSSEMVFGRCRLPLMLVGGSFNDEPGARTLRVKVPRRLADRTVRIESNVEIILTLSNAARFTDMLVEQSSGGTQSQLRLTAYNPLPKSLQRAVFFIQALDEEGEVLGRYRVNWTEPVGPRQRLELLAVVPVRDEASVRKWQVTGAAEPQRQFGPPADEPAPAAR